MNHHLERTVLRDQDDEVGREKFLDSRDGRITDTYRFAKNKGDFLPDPVFLIVVNLTIAYFLKREQNDEPPLIEEEITDEHVGLQLLVVARGFSSVSILA